MSAELSYVQLKTASEARISVSYTFQIQWTCVYKLIETSIIVVFTCPACATMIQEEVRVEQRKRNLLVLIRHYLEDAG